MAVTILEISGRDCVKSDLVNKPYIPDTTYTITDNYPKIHFRVRDSGPKSSEYIKSFTHPKKEKRWFTWSIFGKADISKERTFGNFCHQLGKNGPYLQCYLLPSRLLPFIDVITMVKDVETDLDLCLLWDYESKRTHRAWIRESQFASRATLHSAHPLFRDTLKELNAASMISRERHQLAVVRVSSQRGSPEGRLIGMWALKRLHQLEVAIGKLRIEVEDLTARTTRSLPEARLKEHRERLASTQNLYQQGLKLQRRLRYARQRHAALGELTLTPSMQRDYRLRTLLKAFAPPLSEEIVAAKGLISSLPPVRLPDLFEIWCAVYLVKRLQAMGFSCRPPEKNPCGRAPGLLSCVWRLERDGISLRFEYEPEPSFIESIPPVEERRMSARLWALQGQPPDELISVSQNCTPDFVIRVMGPKGSTMAIGDATLADPDYTTPRKNKIHKLVSYRSSLAWLSAGAPIECHPQGLFVVFPGPMERWKKLEALAAANDCFLLAPTASSPGDKGSASRFQALIELLVRSVS